MEIVQRKINELKSAEYNPRTLNKKQYKTIKTSIEKFGFAEPIVINTHEGREGVIIGGHQRYKIARDLGMQEIPCVELKLDIDKEKELNLRLNKNVGSFDYDMLANLFEKEFLMEVGFDEKELGMFLDEFEEEFYSYDNSNAELPIVPKFSEKHDCLIIVSDNEIDTTFLETTFNIQNAQSYKNTKTGKAMVINVNQVRDQWIKSR
jgi:hypothetical protein